MNSYEILSALRWTALARAGERDQAINEIADAKVATSGSFILACAAAHLLTTAERPLEAAELIDRAKLLVSAHSPESDRLMLAELLFSAERWMEAAALYEPLTPTGQLSGLHTRLLACCVEADSRKKARELLTRLPEGWVDHDEIRRLAMELGQKAGDWAFLVPLADTQVRKAPGHAVSWLFKLHVARHVASPAAFHDMVRQAPEELTGPIRSLAQLSALELRYDEQARGLRRLYRLLRQNFDEPEAFSAYYIGIVAGPPKLPLMDETLLTVAAGSSITLIDETGHELQVVIDPSDVGALPKRSGFFSPDSPEATALLGASVGQTVAVPAQAFGGMHNYTVKVIQSAYRRLIHIAQERAASVGGLPHLKSVPVGTSGDGAKDLTRMHEEIKRSKEISRQIFEAYGEGRLTLSGFAAMQGRSPVDVASGWPSDAPPIFIGTGSAEERADALAALARPDACYVVDAVTLTELVNFGVPEVLAALPKVYIPPVTKQILEDYLSDAETDESFGSAVDVDGKLGFIEYDDEHRKHRIAFAKELLAVADKYCTIRPAYGELIPPAEAPQFVEILKDEELEMLLLAKEHNATLLTLDGRLRLLAKLGADVNGVWPQSLVRHCLATGRLAPAKSAEFAIKQFLTNRKFVSLGSADLVWMVWQGDGYLQRGIQAFKRYLESPETDFQSSSTVALDFLAAIARLETQLGAFGELFVHIIESTFRRKDCPPGFHYVVAKFVHDLPAELAGIPHVYPPANVLRAHTINKQRKYLAERVVEAHERVGNPLQTRPVAVRVLYCTKIPSLVVDKSVSERAPEGPTLGEANDRTTDSSMPPDQTSRNADGKGSKPS